MTMEATGGDAGLEAFGEHRPRMFGIAYRMLGSVAEAEDLVQDAWVRWQQTDHGEVRNAAAFLTTMTTRLAINEATSARARRETYIGPWLPEPVDTSQDPTLGAERAEALDAAVLLLMEKLPPRERAAYVLREAFDYPYDEIARIVGIGEANARQVVSRAKKHVREERKEPVDAAEHRRLLAAFLAAAREGDVRRLEELFAADVVSRSDGAGISRNAARRPVLGRAKVARLVAGFRDRFWPRTEITWLELNGRPAVLVRQDGEAQAVLSLEASADGIEQLLWVMVPAKLARVSAIG